MSKYTYIAAFAALSLASCSNDQEMIFDQSAAERLEQYKKEYAEVLTDRGGLWSMEYFCNADEPGYVFVMEFGKNDAVTISANNVWIDNTFKQETSLWKMIADNGPVLSFCSYNKLFHIFSDPANITGPNAPTGDYGDIDETGFGHEGDYEFQVMEVSEDGNSIRLLGKKRLHDIYMHRLDPDTDPQEYLTSVINISKKVLNPSIPYMVMTDTEGNRYKVSDICSGIPSIFPLSGDSITQTVSANGIFTLDGFRFMQPLEVKKANGDTFEIEDLYFNENGTMSGQNISDFSVSSPLEFMISQNMNWDFDKESFTGKMKTLYDTANAEIENKLSSKYLMGAMEFSWTKKNGQQIVTRLGSQICRDYIGYDADFDEFDNVMPSDICRIKIVTRNSTSEKYDPQVPAYKAFKDYLTSNFKVTLDSRLTPTVLVFTDENDSSSSFRLTAK